MTGDLLFLDGNDNIVALDIRQSILEGNFVGAGAAAGDDRSLRQKCYRREISDQSKYINGAEKTTSSLIPNPVEAAGFR
ncbi:hypothetical protein [Cupriavidus basilensis]|uniref:hypothetical protein n=1 Tax=Cupriavidus basilensis TaxID=68895 RepID=UPI001146F3CC|nr:hypothetical protein [Cupriavidus basilensis]